MLYYMSKVKILKESQVFICKCPHICCIIEYLPSKPIHLLLNPELLNCSYFDRLASRYNLYYILVNVEIAVLLPENR